MTSPVSFVSFITADILMLINILLFSVCFLNAKLADTKIKVIFLCSIHSAYAVIFYVCFNYIQPYVIFLMILLLYSRLIIFPVLITRRSVTAFVYLSLFLPTLQWLIKRTILFISKYIAENSDLSLFENLPSVIFQLIVLFILTMVYRQKTFKNAKIKFKMITKATWALTLSCFFIMHGLITVLEMDTVKLLHQKDLIQFILILFLLILIVVITSLMISNVRENYYVHTSNVLEKQLKSQLVHYEQQQTALIEFRSFKHDHINHMHCIRTLIKENKNSDAVSYIDQLYTLPIFEQQQFDTGNNIADAILSDKYNIARQRGIAFSCKGFFSSKFNVVDLCVILSNALDNAIEACSMFEGEKEIKVKIKMQQGYQLLKILNTCNKISLSENKLPRTTKNNTHEHGYGLMNIQAAVKKNSGKMNISCSDNRFILEISIPIL